MRRVLRYVPLREGQGLDAAQAFSRAAILLDRVATMAIRSQDPDLMLEAADRWTKIGEIFAVVDSEDGHEHIDTNDNIEPYGFHNPVKDRDEVKENDGSD